MAITDNFKTILERQQELVSSLKAEVSALEKSDLVSENDLLKEELLATKTALEAANSSNLQLSTENESLREALYEQIYNEKMAILHTADRKLDLYFQTHLEGELNRLTQFELTAKKRIAEMTMTLQENGVNLEDEIYGKLEELKNLLNQKITLVREELAQKTGAFSRNKEEEFAALREGQITEKELKGIIKKNNLESFIGLNIINKIGIFLLIIGVIAASQFTYFKLPDILKGIFAFSGGLVLLVAGELLNRRKANVFSLGLTSGGIAVLYIALALSYFQLEILEMYPALFLCILITLGAFVLSQRYNAQTIAAFALIGGYLPILSIAGSKLLVFSAMGYFIILNFLALLLSVKKKWLISSFIGFTLNVGASLYIMGLMFSARKYNASFGVHDLITLGYLTFAFVIYTLIPIVGTYFRGTKFKNADIVLLGLNTGISALLMYISFYVLRLEDFTGLLALIFAVIYLSLGRFIETRLAQEKNARLLFYLTGFTFVVLIIPFQFGKMWLSLGWLVEGVALVAYGILKEVRRFQKVGVFISGLCLAAFLFFDVLGAVEYLFAYKYFAITLGSVLILAAAAYKRCLAGTGVSLFKYGTVINVWFFMRYIISNQLADVLAESLRNSYWQADYLIFALMIVVSYLLAYLIPRISRLSDFVMKGISLVIYSVALLSLFTLNGGGTPIRWTYANGPVPLSLELMGALVLIIIGLLSILALRDLVLCLVLERKLGVEWYPLVISAYFVLILTQCLITQYHLAFTNAVISIIYVMTALSWIILGFIRRYALIRRFGLGLTILAVAKLFLLDLSFLSQGGRIISYFSFGVTLLAISFVYQYFQKKLEIKGEIMPNEPKINL
jgi:uncharacterized membrane protein